MSPAELVGYWIMLCFGRALRIAGVTLPLFGALHVMFIIFHDKFLSQHIILTLVATSLFSFACCLLTLSKICVLRKRRHAENKSIDLLYDADLMYENETDEVPHYKLSCHFKDLWSTLKNLSFKNVFEFCKFRPAYGMFLLTGLVCLFTFVGTLKQAKEWDLKDDFYCVALELTVSMIMLISLIYFIANTGFYSVAKDYDMYTPFEQFIHVPMKIIVGKTVAVFLTAGGTYSCLMIFLVCLIALCITSSNYLYHATDMDHVLKSMLPPIFPDARRILKTVFIIMTFMCGHALIGMVVAAYLEAKNSILRIIEKNWQRNLVAISFLLPDIEAKSLEALKTALDHKSTQPLTEKEIIAFNYITWPIWQTKEPFMLCKFETDESPKPESSDKHSDDQDNAENTKQPDATESGHVKPVHVGEPSETVHELKKSGPSEQLGKGTLQEELKLDEEPSTSSAAYLKDLVDTTNIKKTLTRRRKLSSFVDR